MWYIQRLCNGQARKSRENRKYVNTRFWIEKAEGRSLAKRPRRKWQNEIKWSGKVVGEKVSSGSYGSGQGPVAGSCKLF